MRERLSLFLKYVLPGFTLALYMAAVTVGIFSGGIWASLGIGGALIAFFSVWIIDGKPPLPRDEIALLAVAALAVAALLSFNSFNPARSGHETWRLATIFLPLCLWGSPAIRSRVQFPHSSDVVMLAALIGMAIMITELYHPAILKHLHGDGAVLQEYNRGISYLALIAFPLMAQWYGADDAVKKERHSCLSPLVWLFLAAVLFTVNKSESRAAALALDVAIPVTVTAFVFPNLVRYILMPLPILLLAWPFAAQWFFTHHEAALKHFPDSWHARMEIWDYMSYRIMDRPILGWGLGTSNLLPMTPHADRYVYTTVAPGHPHNVLIQLWVELGLPGLALGLAFAYLTLHKAVRLPPQLVPFALSAWMVAFILALCAFNFWTDSSFAAYALTGLGFAAAANPAPTSRHG